jgi:outer membrane murein-binding lipoprotein Lpp
MLTIHLAGSIAHTLPHPLSSLLAFQAEAIDPNQFKWLIIFVAIAAFSLAFMAAVVLVAVLGALKAQKDLSGELSQFRKQAAELIDKSHALVVDLAPKVREISAKVNTITGHVEHLAALVHTKADEIAPTITAANQTVLRANETVREANETVREANFKARAQVSRVDKMVSGALDATVRFGVAIERGIAVPGREVAGVIAGLKAGFETLASAAVSFRNRPPQSRSTTTPPRPTPGPYPTQPPALRSGNEPVRPIYPVKPNTDF